MTPEERDAFAAEYVIGTLDAEERDRARALLARDAAFAALVRAWEDRLAPLDRATAPVEPPRGVFERVVAATGGGPAGEVVELRRRLSRWRTFAAAAGALAAGLAAVVVLDRSKPAPEAAQRYVAVVDTDAALPALIVEVDTAGGTVTVRSLAAERPEGRSLELWVIPEGGAPRSLGLIDPQRPVERIVGERAGDLPTAGAFAVSAEPPGGSPTGAPTGPVVYSGALVPLAD